MILADTSVWVDHFRKADPQLMAALEHGVIAVHPFVVGEVACGSLSNRALVLELMQNLPATLIAQNDEVLGFMGRQNLYGRGIGYVDVHLLASVALTAGSVLWTRDKRLHTAAHSLGIAHREVDLH